MGVLDLLHKSGFEFEFQIVVDGNHQIKTESQTSSLAIRLAQNSKDL
jgi:hypothetical protein